MRIASGNPFTFEAWEKTETNRTKWTEGGDIFRSWMHLPHKPTGADTQFWMVIEPSGKYQFQHMRHEMKAGVIGPINNESRVVSPSFQPGKWRHVAGVSDGVMLQLFVDGRSVAKPSPLPKGIHAFSHSCYIGPKFDGLIDEVRLSNVARYTKDFTPQSRFEPDEQTIALYHFDKGEENTAWDASDNHLHGKILGATWVKKVAPGKYVPSSADRRAAEWVIAKGGEVNVKVSGDPEWDFYKLRSTVDELPARFSLYSVYFLNDESNESLSDEDMSVLAQHIKAVGGQIKGLTIKGSWATDAGLKHLKGLQISNLRFEDSTKVTDDGVRYLKDMPNLKSLQLSRTGVTDEALKSIGQMRDVFALHLGRTEISDSGLAHLTLLGELRDLHVPECPKITDAGLVHISKLANLKFVHLVGTSVTNKGLQSLERLKNLQSLSLGATSISDEAVVSLSRMKQLTYLHIPNTKITASGAAALRKALPNCEIIHESIPRSVDPDRRAAEWVFSLGGAVVVDGKYTDQITSIDRLPTEKFHITHVFLKSAKPVTITKENVQRLAALKELSVLSLNQFNIPEDAFGVLPEIKKLQSLNMKAQRVTEDGMAHIAAIPNLESLVLDSGFTSPESLLHIAKMTKLIFLWMPRTTTDEALQHLLPLRQLRRLNLYHTQVTDQGLRTVAKLKNLETLNIHGTKVTSDGIAELQKELPNCKIFWDGNLTWQPTAEQQAFFDEVAKLPAAQQVEAVARKLQEINPGFDGKVDHKIENGRVVELRFITDQVTDIAPVRALSDLERLWCNGSGPYKGRLADLSPLQDLPLTFLHCGGTRVADLSPLMGMKLTVLLCDHTLVADLSPVKGMPLTNLACHNTRVADLSPLQGMKLTRLNCVSTRVADISPLQGMPLATLDCQNTRIADLSPLQGVSLTYLNCRATLVSDLAPLKGMSLTTLHCDTTRVSDLSPLVGMPLTSLSCSASRVSDLSPLQGMPLTTLDCQNTRIADLSPLQGMPLEHLSWDVVRLHYTADETLLKSLPLKTVRIYPFENEIPVADFWKQFAERRQAAEGFVESTAKLPAEKQVEAVRARLKKLKPNLAATLGAKTVGEAVTEVTLTLSNHPHDLTPLIAFNNLKKLTITGGSRWIDISAISRVPLEELLCSDDIAFKNSPVLKGIKTLKTINGLPAAAYWKTMNAKREK